MKKPELAFKCFIRFLLARAAMTWGVELMAGAFRVYQFYRQGRMGRVIIMKNAAKGGGGMTTDEALYRRYLSGDEDALGTLMERYGTKLTLYLDGYLCDLKSFEADYKTMLIWLPEAMNEEAANKILKILEEPWDRTLFILVCEHPDRLLPTIVSRTQEVCVPRIAPDVLERVAQQRGVADPLQARNMARLAGGDLLELGHLVAGESDAMRKEHFDLFCSLMRLSYNDRHLELVAWAEDAAQLTREQQRAFLRDAARLLRESFMLHAGIREVSYLWGEELAFCSKFAPFVGPRNIEPLIAEIESAAAQIAQNGNPTIVFTHFALSVSKMIKHL